MNQMIIIGLIMVGVGVLLMLFAHKMNEQNPRLSQYLAMTFLFLFLWGCALMIWGSGGHFAAVVFATLGTALPLYCLKGMKGTENMSDDELKEYIEDQFEDTSGTDKSVLQFRYHAGDLVEGLGVLVRIA